MIAMSILIFALGLAIGSFLNVCIYRLPQGLSIHSPRRSFCPECRTTIRFYDNIPVLSYLCLKGRCRHCDIRNLKGLPTRRADDRSPVSVLAVSVRTDARTFAQLSVHQFVDTYRLDRCAMVHHSERHHPCRVDHRRSSNSPHCVALPQSGLSDRSPNRSSSGWCLNGIIIAVAGTFLFRKRAMGGGDIKLMILIGLFLGGWPHLPDCDYGFRFHRVQLSA